MSYGQIAILTLIVGLFTAFGALLGWASWYSRPRAQHRDSGQHGVYPSSGGLITDDD
jgi:hypothetical protein